MVGGLIVFNAGSSSLKFSLFRLAGAGIEPVAIADGQVEGLGSPAARVRTRRLDGPPSVSDDAGFSLDDDGALMDSIMGWAAKQLPDSPLIALGHRIVHGGPDFSTPVLLDAAAIAALEALTPLAPLHMPRDLRPVRSLLSRRPDLPQIACFDTAFHHALPRMERLLGLPRSLAEREKLYRYGFHGLSYEYIAAELRRLDLPTARGRVVCAHLGAGASLCAMVDGRSTATTMGFSTLDGLLMATRCGAMDPGVLLHLLRRNGQDVESLEQLLYRQSGLLGVSGGASADMKTLLSQTSEAAREAVDLFVYRIRRELGAMIATMGGMDALVFTGGIGEHAADIRRAVVGETDWFGLRLDRQANARADLRLDAPGSSASIWRIATDENRVIARHCQSLLAGTKGDGPAD